MMRHVPLLALLCSSSFALAAPQSDAPWFELELIAFERAGVPALKEQFRPVTEPLNTLGSQELLADEVQPVIESLLQALPSCQTTPLDAQNEWTPMPTALAIAIADAELALAQSDDQVSDWLDLRDEQQIAEHGFQQQALWCDAAASHLQLAAFQPPRRANAPTQLPVTPQGEATHREGTYLVPPEQLQLKDLAYQLSQRGGHQLLLHMAWRQQLSPKRYMRPIHLIAGRQWSPEFDSEGLPVLTSQSDPSLEPAIQRTERLLNTGADLSKISQANQSTGPVWQLDGTVLSFNERMLFADLDLLFRQRVAMEQPLRQFRIKHQVRLLLGDVNYLDHPYLGLVLQIRRFSPPLQAAESVTLP